MAKFGPYHHVCGTIDVTENFLNCRNFLIPERRKEAPSHLVSLAGAARAEVDYFALGTVMGQYKSHS